MAAPSRGGEAAAPSSCLERPNAAPERVPAPGSAPYKWRQGGGAARASGGATHASSRPSRSPPCASPPCVPRTTSLPPRLRSCPIPVRGFPRREQRCAQPSLVLAPTSANGGREQFARFLARKRKMSSMARRDNLYFYAIYAYFRIHDQRRRQESVNQETAVLKFCSGAVAPATTREVQRSRAAPCAAAVRALPVRWLVATRPDRIRWVSPPSRSSPPSLRWRAPR